MGNDVTTDASGEQVPPEVPGEAQGRVKERIAIDVGSTMAAMNAMDEARLSRGKGDKMKFLSPAQLAIGINTLKILPPWTRTPPHAGRFWRAVWVHFGLGPAGETKTALCARRMNRLGLPRMKGEESLGRCPVCEALEAIWAIPFESRSPEEKRFLGEYKPRQNYLFNVVWLKGGGKDHSDEGTQVLICSPSLGEPILTAFKFVLTYKPDVVPDNFDIQVKKLPNPDKVFNGKPVFDYQEVFPAMPPVELDLEDPRFERYALDAIYRPKETTQVADLFRQTPCGAALLGPGAAIDVTPGERRALPPVGRDTLPAFPRGLADDDAPFEHGPATHRQGTPAPTIAQGPPRLTAGAAVRAVSREPGEDDLDDATLTTLAARGPAATSREELSAQLMRAARR